MADSALQQSPATHWPPQQKSALLNGQAPSGAHVPTTQVPTVPAAAFRLQT